MKPFYSVHVLYSPKMRSHFEGLRFARISDVKNAIEMARANPDLMDDLSPVYEVTKCRVDVFGNTQDAGEEPRYYDWDLKPYKRFCVVEYRKDGMYKRDGAQCYAKQEDADARCDEINERFPAIGYVVREIL